VRAVQVDPEAFFKADLAGTRYCHNRCYEALAAQSQRKRHRAVSTKLKSKLAKPAKAQVMPSMDGCACTRTEQE
jgi:uncharacterized protein YdaU (DUF1376 family)